MAGDIWDWGGSLGSLLLRAPSMGLVATADTRPNFTDSCWICLQERPPYYEGVAVSGHYHKNKSSALCNWDKRHMLTLPEVTGKRICLGTAREIFPDGSADYSLVDPHLWAMHY